MGGHGIVSVTGELTTKAFVDVREIVKRIVGDKYGVQVNIVQQSPEIGGGVDTGGAGDQGIMVGYACRKNKEMIPHELYLARSLCAYIYEAHPTDGKTQITLNEKDEVEDVVISWCKCRSAELSSLFVEWKALNGVRVSRESIGHFNPAGDWAIGGFEADTGVTGRKLAVDNYGPQVPIGGGAFSGKDATKVDRSAAYKARQLAVRYLDYDQDAQEVIVKIAYAIGYKYPVMATVKIDNGIESSILEELKEELTPARIIEDLQLRKPQFERLAASGHFGTNNIWDGATNN